MQKHKNLIFFITILFLMHALHGLLYLVADQFELTNLQLDQVLIITVPLIGILSIWVILKYLKIELNLFWQRVNPKTIFYVILLALFLFLVGFAIDMAFLKSLLESQIRFLKWEALFQAGINHTLWTIAAIFFAPVIEEILYRRLIFSELKEQYGLTIGLVVSSFLFALVHWDFEGLLAYFIIGLVFAYLYHLTKVLWLSILVHTICNILAFSTTIEIYDSSDRMYFIIMLGYLISAAGVYTILKELKLLTKDV